MVISANRPCIRCWPSILQEAMLREFCALCFDFRVNNFALLLDFCSVVLLNRYSNVVGTRSAQSHTSP